MVRTAEAFITALEKDQQGKALHAFDSDERLNWHYFPKVRGGVCFRELSASQSALGLELIKSALSAEGFVKVSQIIALEAVLRELEGGANNPAVAAQRDPQQYYIAIFGAPSSEQDWGWRLEGHHVSLNFTIINGTMIASAPTFLGANPHRVMSGELEGARPLGDEEDYARQLLLMLAPEQRAEAMIAAHAPRDILTGAQRKAELEGPPQGLTRSKMTVEQRTALDRLINLYIDNMHPHLAEQRRERLAAMSAEEWDAVRFAWMGSPEPGQAHYYRVHAPSFLVEYDNIQNNANHSHTVWRDWNGDFGLDLLALHRADGHADR
jgi:hypothetical protein